MKKRSYIKKKELHTQKEYWGPFVLPVHPHSMCGSINVDTLTRVKALLLSTVHCKSN